MRILEKQSIDLTKYVPPLIYSNNNIMKSIYKSQGDELDGLLYCIEDLINQCFIETATWSLSSWENEFGVKAKMNDTLENRRSRVLAKKRGTSTTTKQVVKDICNSFVDNTSIIEYSSDYYFELILESYSGFHNFLEDLMDIIEELKPAHLGVNYELKATTKSNIYIGLAAFDGEIVNTYPWTPNDIESKAEYYIPIIQPSSLETINTYPKEVV
ncbi:putative phage tail protein [Clostridium sp. YIM B02569]|uniref:putative phage tail protein n=1 Tax=Clostridium sp. YIM B02569 TaxID=2911967 RepID=UPI001EEF0901|nr:putative phage tail protein [Clostridium sp. YIM B02569]